MNDKIKVCPDCGGKIVIRRYTEFYEDHEIDPETVQESETSCEDGEVGGDDWMLYCTGCGWELYGEDAEEED
jgi:hypothetical protein